MKLAAILEFLLVVCLSVACFRARRQRRGMKNAVHLPFSTALVGMVCGTGFCGCLLIPDPTPGYVLGFSLFVAVCLCLMLAYHNCLIRYDRRGFQARNFWGVERQCTWREIETVRMSGDCRIRFQGHWLLVDQMAQGREGFLSTMTEGYWQATGKPLPIREKRPGKKDPMGGNLRHPWFYLILWVLLGGGLCLGSLWFTVYTLTMPRQPEPEELTPMTVTFSDSKFSDSHLKLSVPGQEEPYLIDNYSYYNDRLPDPKTLRSGQSWHIGVRNPGQKGQEIRYLESETGQVFLTPELAWEVERATYRVMLPLVLLMGLFLGSGLYFGIAVARHPQRYKPWFRRLYYKDEAFLWDVQKNLPR